MRDVAVQTALLHVMVANLKRAEQETTRAYKTLMKNYGLAETEVRSDFDWLTRNQEMLTILEFLAREQLQPIIEFRVNKSALHQLRATYDEQEYNTQLVDQFLLLGASTEMLRYLFGLQRNEISERRKALGVAAKGGPTPQLSRPIARAAARQFFDVLLAKRDEVKVPSEIERLFETYNWITMQYPEEDITMAQVFAATRQQVDIEMLLEVGANDQSIAKLLSNSLAKVARIRTELNPNQQPTPPDHVRPLTPQAHKTVNRVFGQMRGSTADRIIRTLRGLKDQSPSITWTIDQVCNAIKEKKKR